MGDHLVTISTKSAISPLLGFAVKSGGFLRGRESGETIEIYLNLDALSTLSARFLSG